MHPELADELNEQLEEMRKTVDDTLFVLLNSGMTVSAMVLAHKIVEQVLEKVLKKTCKIPENDFNNMKRELYMYNNNWIGETVDVVMKGIKMVQKDEIC
jgi:hypothetical protein